MAARDGEPAAGASCERVYVEPVGAGELVRFPRFERDGVTAIQRVDEGLDLPDFR